MNLVIRFLAARRDKLLMRLGCWLVCFSLVLGLMLPQQRAEALVAELSMTAVASVAAAYLGACGLPFITKGMDKDALVSSVQRLLQEFLDTELGGISIQDWLGGVWDLTVMAGKLLLGRSLTEEFVSFAQWVVGKYAAQAGENRVYYDADDYITLKDGSKLYLSSMNYNGNNSTVVSLGTIFHFPIDSPIVFSSGYYFANDPAGDSSYWVAFFNPQGTKITGNKFWGATNFCFSFYDDTLFLFWDSNGVFKYCSAVSLRDFNFGAVVSSDESLSIDRAPSMSYIPDGIAAEQGIALDVGAAATMDLDLVLQGVLEDVLAGELTSTMEVAGEAVVDPPAGEITDVDNLGLPALGQALISRFPFSIPWDFFRAVQLLAAPAKAPRFKVDFMQPIEHRVGEWQGDTTIVLDFAEYAIIGQISRWTSTIGFCLMLVGATKRLIWTA
ncbi:MAG: hypothetical protein HFF56_05245 [Lawsonibacter sp.]|nr:hypothetical protein [Lawsonibacter sp.]